MSRGRFSSGFYPLAVLLLLWGVAFSMATQLTLHPIHMISSDTSVAERLLGASRVAFGSSFFEEADSYFHRGVGHVRQKAFSNDIFQLVSAVLEPSGHVHAEGGEVTEIMPWLRFTTKMDPNNVDAYLTTAYWLNDSIRRPDVAEAVLREAQQMNPNDYRVINERAKMLFGTENDDKAALLLDAAIRLWPIRKDPADEQTQLDLSQMLSYRAFLYEIKGDRAKAVECFRKAYVAMPNNKALEQRIRALERGESFSEKDRQLWESIFARHHVCARDDAEHGHDE